MIHLVLGMKYLTISLLCLYGAAAPAQDCDRETLKTLPGKWLSGPADAIEGAPNRPSAAEIAGAKKTMNAIQQLFQEQYTLTGVDAYHYPHYINDYNQGTITYGNRSIYTLRNFQFFCSDGKKKTSAEGTGSFIHINRGGTLSGEFKEKPIYDEHGEVNKQLDSGGGFNFLNAYECPNGKLPDLTDGYHVIDEGSTYSMWITFNGKQPYRYVSRKEFLEKQVAIGEAKLKELNKQYSKPEMLKAMEAAGGAYKENILKGKKLATALLEKPLEAYRQDLKKDAAWLNEMAVVNFTGTSDPELSRFVFTTVNEPQMFVPIMPNPGYYNRSLPKWAPQFILIEIRGADRFFGKNVRNVVDNHISFFKSLLANP